MKKKKKRENDDDERAMRELHVGDTSDGDERAAKGPHWHEIRHFLLRVR